MKRNTTIKVETINIHVENLTIRLESAIDRLGDRLEQLLRDKVGERAED